MTGSTAALRLSLISVVLLMLTSGCAIMSKSDCLQGHWAEAGNHDALRGYTSSARLHSRMKVCQKHGVSANKVDYLLGYKEGLEHYCQPERALSAGVNNHTYRGICPVEMEKPFLEQYISGLSIARRDIWFRYQWLEDELFDARIHRRRDDQKRHQYVEERIARLSNRLDDLRARQFDINRKIALWSQRLQEI